MKNLTKLALALVMVLTFQVMLFAADKSITVSATVPALTGILEVKILQLTAVDALDPAKDWATATEVTNMDFGILNRNAAYNIFTANKYFAVEAVVLDNSGRGWTLSHAVNSVKYLTENIDESINVSFTKQVVPRGRKPAAGVDYILPDATDLRKSNYKDSNNVQYDRAALQGNIGGWLRIYYGIATGNADRTRGEVDPPGSLPIPLYQQAGPYSGGVTITLTPT